MPRLPFQIRAFTQVPSAHAGVRSPRFVVDPRPLPYNCQDGARHWCAATNARRSPVCVWQRHRRNVSTLSNRTPRRQMRDDRIKCLELRTYRTSCINATDSICRRARMESQSVVKLGQWARVENAPKKAQLSKGRREARRSRPQGPAQIESVALCVWQCHLRDRPRLTTP